ncbi:MAG: hypothetical protein IJV40_16780 [Oscillospiraceae bacterium]|nr:hypothetical protein [Oscillospiraceae bacterium]
MRELNIAYGNSCTAKKWSNKTITWEALGERLKTTIRTSESVEEYQKMKRAERESAKDKGGFVGGQLSGGRRKRECVASRSMLTMDADAASPDFIDTFSMLSPYASYLYTTHGHTPEAPRVRIIVPFTRDASPDEYQAIGRYFAAEWGIDQFDECSYRPHQLMYWPTTPANGEYVFKEMEGEALDPDAFLDGKPWRDCSLLPTSSRESVVREKSGKKAEDPLGKSGAVGAFCRAYPISRVMAEMLSDVYEEAAIPGRYQYREADSSSGVIVYDDKFSYSFHASDPACGLLLNAFDLVRVHRYPDEDEKKSFQKMAEYAVTLDDVKVELAKEKEAEANEDFAEGEDWRTRLTYQPRSSVLENSAGNLILILENDPDYSGFAFNQMAGRVEVVGKVPWERPDSNTFWRDADTAQLKASLDRKYLAFTTRNHDVAFAKVADDRSFHPIREYLQSLPPWDGKKRVERILIDCLEAEDTEYVRVVTRKTFAAAVARIMRPGIKFDSVLVLDGVQGIGKSSLFKDLIGDEYYCETLTLKDMNEKAGAEKLQGYWIVEVAELAGMKKADIESVKAFLTATDDKYRPSYGRVVESHPRQCIIIASVNGERGYLRDITGNRRYWVVKVKQTEQRKRWNFSQDEKDQIWAEAKKYYEEGEKLYLEGEMIAQAEGAQMQAMEEDERKGLVEEYLNTPLPANWDKMDLYERRNWLSEKDGPTAVKGERVRNEVSNVEIWSECFGNPTSSLRPQDSYSIAALMTQIPGWERTTRSIKLPIYGKQRLYVRTEGKAEGGNEGTKEQKN